MDEGMKTGKTSWRIEKDTMGEILVPGDKYWGAQTQRSLENFKIGKEKMPEEILRAFAVLKKAAARTNEKLGVLDSLRAKAIASVCDEILDGKHGDQFPLLIYQTGSGTQSNMNFNEVIAHRGNEILGDNLLHPNDHVNKSQSSNDTFPSAMHMAALAATVELIPAIETLENTFLHLEKENAGRLKTGRTHLQDATPLTLGQEISAWTYMLKRCTSMLRDNLEGVSELALGGTAVGTGLHAPPGFAEEVAEQISSLMGLKFKTSPNKFHALTSQDSLVTLHGVLKALAGDLMKIANDIRWLASGPRCGIGEIRIPENEPGSSIMPGKVNPTQCEALTMVCARVMGNDVTVGLANSQGNFQLNVYMPVMAAAFLESAALLRDAILSFEEHCARGIKANPAKIAENLQRSLMLVTALSPVIGYDHAAKVAKTAEKENLTLKEAAVKLGLLTEQEYDEIVVVEKMV